MNHSNTAKIRQARELIHQALRLVDEVHTGSSNLESHNVSIDVENALRKSLPLVAKLHEIESK